MLVRWKEVIVAGGLALFFASAGCLQATDPTFLRRYLPSIQPKDDDLTRNARSASYRPIFGIGDKDAEHLRSVVRYGELTVGPGGASAVVGYPAEEQIYFILEGTGTLLYGEQRVPVKKNDYIYLPVGVSHGIMNSSGSAVRLLVMGFRILEGTDVPPTPKLMMGNTEDVPLEVRGAHGPTSKYRILIGGHDSEDYGLPAAHTAVGMYTIHFSPTGTNIPHHHPMEEEIYIVLQGYGEMVAGGGTEGIEGRHPAKAGDVYFFRLNATVGFYSGNKEGEPESIILAVRSRYPFPFLRKR